METREEADEKKDDENFNVQILNQEWEIVVLQTRDRFLCDMNFSAILDV